MASKSIVVKRRHKNPNRRDLDPEVINEHPMEEGRIRQFIDETEGKENKGGDPRKDATRTKRTSATH